MKPFDLQKALSGHPVVTRNGKKVIDISHFSKIKNEKHRLQVFIEGYDCPLSYTEQGIWGMSGSSGSENYDLFLE